MGNLTKVLDGFPERSQVGLLLLHLLHESQVACTNLCPGVLRLVGQDLSRLTHLAGYLQRWPEGGSRLEPFAQQLV